MQYLYYDFVYILSDFQGLNTFIQICTNRAATDGDDILDQITKLNTLGLVFHAIIYDLPANCNADQLNEAWKAAWIAQQSNGRDMKRLSVLWVCMFVKLINEV